MPIYAYRCSACGYAKDQLQKMSDPVLTVCPECHAPTFQKQVTAAGFQLKGSGWYVTDFRGGNKPGAKGADAEGAKGAEGAQGETPPATEAGAAKGESGGQGKGDAKADAKANADANAEPKSSAKADPAAAAPTAAPAPPASPGSK